jgi:hypothetical protein
VDHEQCVQALAGGEVIFEISHGGWMAMLNYYLRCVLLIITVGYDVCCLFCHNYVVSAPCGVSLVLT